MEHEEREHDHYKPHEPTKRTTSCTCLEALNDESSFFYVKILGSFLNSFLFFGVAYCDGSSLV